jgi:glycyl-tRNA synthetase beta chain
MSELILELYSEEIPALAQQPAADGFTEIFTSFCNKQNIKFAKVESFSGPCRITLRITGLIFEAFDENIRGPKKDSSEVVINGFCNKNKASIDELIIKSENGIEYYFLHKKNTHTLESLLLDNISKLISSYSWPKSMKWGSYAISWIRPLKNILCLLDGKVLQFQHGHLNSNNLTFGHKFFHSNAIKINSWQEYENSLSETKVILSRDTRKALIQTQLATICQKHSLILNQDPKLLDEIVGLVEHPKVLLGNIPEKFIRLPQELLISCLRLHQKYFTCNNYDGGLASKFLFVCNSPLEDCSNIISGNEKVLNARLSDALYFYEQDLKHSLESRLTRLHKVVFHSKIGTMLDKAIRLEQICKFLSPTNHDLHLAAKLCKCDLITEVVSEFPELQGIISSYYAANDGLNSSIGECISEHYNPQGANDQVPKGDAAILSLADKLDNLVGLLLAGEKATSSKDPYGLRRNAIGILRIILSNQLPIDLNSAITYVVSLYKLPEAATPDFFKQLNIFIVERLKNLLSKDYDPKIINCVITDEITDIVAGVAMLEKLSAFCKTPKWQISLSAYKRIVNIIGKNSSIGLVNEQILHNEYEKKLWQQSNVLLKRIPSNDFFQNIDEIALLVTFIDAFFDNVLVNDENKEVAQNRLNLSKYLRDIFDQVLNFRSFL